MFWALFWAFWGAREVGRAFFALGPGVLGSALGSAQGFGFVILALRRRMALDAAELRRGLDRALGVSGVPAPNTQASTRSSIRGGLGVAGGMPGGMPEGLDGDCAAWRYTGPGFCLEACCWSVPPLRLGSLRLVQSMVSLRLHGLEAATVSVLLRRVDLALQRGGG